MSKPSKKDIGTQTTWTSIVFVPPGVETMMHIALRLCVGWELNNKQSLQGRVRRKHMYNYSLHKFEITRQLYGVHLCCKRHLKLSTRIFAEEEREISIVNREIIYTWFEQRPKENRGF